MADNEDSSLKPSPEEPMEEFDPEEKELAAQVTADIDPQVAASMEEPAKEPIEETLTDVKAAPIPGDSTEATEGGGFVSEFTEEDETAIEGSTSPSKEALSPQEEKRLSQVYTEITLKVESQNRIINTIKNNIKEKCYRYPRTACEDREICNLKICLEQENLKLQCLVKEAMCVQSKDPDRRWPPIAVATTFDEDCMPLRVNYNAMTTCFGPMRSDTDIMPKQKSGPKPFRCPAPPLSSSDMTDDSSCEKILRDMQNKSKKGKGLSKELTRSYSMQEKLVADNADLEGDRYKLQEEVLGRDRMIECLQQKVCLMHAELTKLCRQRHGGKDKDRSSCFDEVPRLQSRLQEQDSTTKCLSMAIDKIQNAFERLKIELDGVKKSRERSDHAGRDEYRSEKSVGVAKRELQDVKKKYCELLEDFNRKERELSGLKEKVNAFCEGREQRNDSRENNDVEVRLLREKLKECRDEQEEFKIIVCEQSKQTEDYREKYIASLQKIEELKCILQKMEMDNKRIEDQINLEVQRIKDKFQQKLQEWAHLPQMLENEQLKLSQCCKEKDDIENKLRIVCRELKAVKAQMGLQTEQGANDPDKVRQLEGELAELKSQYDILMECKNRLCEKYEQVKKELDCLRTESAKIICRLKERAEANQAALQKHVDQLEQELAQCRATACLSIADREEVIKDMQSQLNCLSVSFDSAQKQIKSLKDHVSYMSSGKANSVVICCQNQTC